MNFDESKEFLKNEYIRIGFELIEEQESEMILRYRDNDWILTEEDIKEYCDFHNNIQSDFQVLPTECSITSPNYRENVVVSIDVRRRPPSLYFRDREAIFGEVSSENIYASIGPASNLFLNYFRFNEDFFSRSGMVWSSYRQDDRKPDIRDWVRKPLTIKVFNMSEKDVERAVIKSSKVFEDCLFQLAYLKNISLWIVEEWPYKRPSRSDRFSFIERYSGWELPLNTSFNSNLIRFYQFGMSANIPEQKFLSFYQVLEYFFISASNEKLYEKLENKLKDPRFTYSSRNLDRLVQDVINHRHETDETVMLRNVLEKYIVPNELIEFIKAYEKHLDEKIYSKRHNVFGENVEVKLEEGHVISNLSKHVKEVRNALVHSTDRHERRTRHIPFTKTTKIIEKDIPLLKYLAERVIISSSTSL